MNKIILYICYLSEVNNNIWEFSVYIHELNLDCELLSCAEKKNKSKSYKSRKEKQGEVHMLEI